MARALVGGDAVGLRVGEKLAVHGQERLGLLLQVGVHDADDGAARVLEAGEKGRLLAEVAREVDGLHVRRSLGGGELLDQRPGAVLRAVVDEDELVVEAGGAEDVGRPVEQQGKTLLLVVAGDDYRKVQASSKEYAAAVGLRPTCVD